MPLTKRFGFEFCPEKQGLQTVFSEGLQQSLFQGLPKSGNIFVLKDEEEIMQLSS